MQSDLERVLIPRERIAQRIVELGGEISRDLSAIARDGERGDILIIPVLTGSVIFVADLMRQLPHKIRIHMVTVSSYPGRTMESQGAELTSDLPDDLSDKHVLIVDDILDSGRTIRLLRDEILKRRPRSLRACVLLRKDIPSALATQCEYVGFDIPNDFVVGYGLDYDDYYRNLPDIGVLKSALTDEGLDDAASFSRAQSAGEIDS